MHNSQAPITLISSRSIKVSWETIKYTLTRSDETHSYECVSINSTNYNYETSTNFVLVINDHTCCSSRRISAHMPIPYRNIHNHYLKYFWPKDTIDNSYFLNYCSPWKMNEYYFPIASNVSDWLDPRIK